MERGPKNRELCRGIFFVRERIISAVKRVEFVRDRMSVAGRWCLIIVQNVHAPTVDKTDEVEDSFYEELERVFDKFPKYEMKILLGYFSDKIGREDSFTKLVMTMELE
jgi:hypothetical protein